MNKALRKFTVHFDQRILKFLRFRCFKSIYQFLILYSYISQFSERSGKLANALRSLHEVRYGETEIWVPLALRVSFEGNFLFDRIKTSAKMKSLQHLLLFTNLAKRWAEEWETKKRAKLKFRCFIQKWKWVSFD